MKNQFLFSLLIFLTAISLMSQTDRPWYILDGNWEAEVGASPVPASFTDFTINGVKPISKCCNPKAANDIFIIFDDLTYYNSRYHNGYNTNASTVRRDWDFNGNSLAISASKPVSHLYWSKIYDPIDPPPVEAVSSVTGTINSISPNASDVNKLVTTNHDIVPGKDFTVILDTKLLGEQSETSKGARRGDTLVLFFEVDTSGNVIPDLAMNHVDMERVFNSTNSAVLPLNSTGAKTNNYIPLFPLNNETEFIYVNMQASTDMIPHLEYQPDESSNGRMKIGVGYLNNGNISEVSSIYENIRNNFDPNQLIAHKFVSVDGSDYVHYSGMYSNDGNATASNTRVEFDLPNSIVNSGDFDVSKLNYMKVTHGEDLITSEVEIKSTGNRVTIDPENITLSVCDLQIIKNNPNKKFKNSVYFEFLMPVEDKSDYLISDAVVYFDAVDTEVPIFDHIQQLTNEEEWTVAEASDIFQVQEHCTSFLCYCGFVCWILIGLGIVLLILLIRMIS